MTKDELLISGVILNHLDKMSKKSDEMIAEQQNTNQELNMLRSQMASANSMQQQMLQNQIHEIEEKETQKFYKLRSFKLNQLTTCIDNLSDINQKAFTYYVFKDIITERATEAQANLNEISDKEYCNSTLAKLRSIYQQLGDIRQLSIAEYLMKFINSKDEYDRLSTALANAKSALKTPPPPIPSTKLSLKEPIILFVVAAFLTCGGLAMYFKEGDETGFYVLIVPLICFALSLIKYLKKKKKIDQAKTDYETNSANYEAFISNAKAQVASLQNEIANCDYVKSLSYFFTTYPNWEIEINNDYKMLEY